ARTGPGRAPGRIGAGRAVFPPAPARSGSRTLDAGAAKQATGKRDGHGVATQLPHAGARPRRPVGLELTLVGALEVQSWSRDPASGDLRALGRDWLGPADGTWFEGDQNHVHRCRNLSGHDMALTLHVY